MERFLTFEIIKIPMEKKNKLSRREQQLIELLQKGYNRKNIALTLELKTETINSYFKNLYRKLNVNSAAQALRKVEMIDKV
jgi:DNA-binding NarL/FixJ family response regulator